MHVDKSGHIKVRARLYTKYAALDEFGRACFSSNSRRMCLGRRLYPDFEVCAQLAPWESHVIGDSKGSYAKSWRQYRRVRFVAVLLFLGFLPIMILGISLDHVFETPFFSYSVAAGWLVAALVSVWMWAYWPCPRCGRGFKGWSLSRLLPKRCAHCSLPRWAESDDVSPEGRK